MKKLLPLLLFIFLSGSSNAQLYLHNPSFEYPVGVSWIFDPLPEWKYCIGGKNGIGSVSNTFDTSDLSKPFGKPSDLYYYIFIGAKTYYNDAGNILYPDAYRATLSNSFVCEALLNGHKYQISIDACRFDDPPPTGNPYLNIFFGNSSCDTFYSVGGSFVTNIDWQNYKFSFLAKDSWSYFTLRCENHYLDSNIKELMEVSLKLDNLSPVTPDTAYNSEHFPIQSTCKGLGVYLLRSPYEHQEQYWYEGDKLLGSGDSIEVSPVQKTSYTLVLGRDSCIPSVLQTTVTPDCGSAQLFFPNAFTPNGDAKNTLFRVIQNANLWQLRDYELSVYNRWGQRIWQSKDYSQGWDGANADNGVYFWLCRYTLADGTKQVQKGDVTLLR